MTSILEQIDNYRRQCFPALAELSDRRAKLKANRKASKRDDRRACALFDRETKRALKVCSIQFSIQCIFTQHILYSIFVYFNSYRIKDRRFLTNVRELTATTTIARNLLNRRSGMRYLLLLVLLVRTLYRYIINLIPFH